MIGILLFNDFLSKKLSNLMPKKDSRYEIRETGLIFYFISLISYLQSRI